MTYSSASIEPLLNDLAETIEPTGLGIDDWLVLSDELLIVAERLEMLAGCLHHLPCRECGGSTDRQPVSFSFSRTALTEGLLDYLSIAAMCGTLVTGDWADLFAAERIDRVAIELGGNFPRTVAFFTAAVCQARLAGWSESIDEALLEGWFDELVPVGTCRCPAR